MQKHLVELNSTIKLSGSTIITNDEWIQKRKDLKSQGKLPRTFRNPSYSVELNRPKQLPWNEITNYLNGHVWDFVVEPKRDGVRMLMGNYGDSNQYNRDGLFSEWNQYSPVFTKDKFPEIHGELHELIGEYDDTILDGELVTVTDEGDNFWNTSSRVLSGINKQRLLSQIESRKVKYVVFDILMKKGEPCINMELKERRQILEKLFGDKKLERIELIERLHPENATENYCNEHNLEGVIIKGNNTVYSSTWYKAKAYVDGVFEIRSVRDGKRDYIMTLYDGETCVGDCTLFVKHVENATVENTDTFIGKKVEVSYMKGNTTKLRFPVFKRFVE